MISKIPKSRKAILVSIGLEIIEVTISGHQTNLNYGNNNLSGVPATRGPAYLIQHNNKSYNIRAKTWDTQDWNPWGKVWIEPGRLFHMCKLTEALSFRSTQTARSARLQKSPSASTGGGASSSSGASSAATTAESRAGGGATSGAGASASKRSRPTCQDCGGHKKHVRLGDGKWCPRSRRAAKAQQLAQEGNATL